MRQEQLSPGTNFEDLKLQDRRKPHAFVHVCVWVGKKEKEKSNEKRKIQSE